MSITESAPMVETQDPLMPGTISHLDYLAKLEVIPPQTLQEVQGFLVANSVAESFSKLINEHRTHSPLSHWGGAVLDSRLIGSQADHQSTFRGSLSLSENNPQLNRVRIDGRPKPNETVLYNYTYDLSIPLLPDLTLDLRRPVEAFYARGSYSDMKTFDRWIYLSQASQGYDENDPTVFMCAVQEAAGELAALLRRQKLEPPMIEA